MTGTRMIGKATALALALYLAGLVALATGQTMNQLTERGDYVVVGVAPEEEMIAEMIEAWGPLPAGGAWVGGYDGGAYVWLGLGQASADDVVSGAIYLSTKRYQGRFARYAPPASGPVRYADMRAADMGGVLFEPGHAAQSAEQQVNPSRLVPIDTHSGFADPGQGPSATVTAVDWPAAVPRSATRVFDHTGAYYVMVEQRTGAGFFASIFDAYGVRVAASRQFDVIERHAERVAEFSARDLVSFDARNDLLVTASGVIFEALAPAQ